MTGALHTCPKCRRRQRPDGALLCPACTKREATGTDHSTKLPVIIYDRLFNAFTEKQSLSYAARKAGCDEETAKKYIDGPADPARGLAPIRKRFQDAMRKAMVKTDYGLQKALEGSLELMKTAKYALSKQLVRDNFRLDPVTGEVLLDAAGAPIMRPDAISVNDVYGAIARVTQAELDLLDRMAGPGNRPSDLFDGWSQEELDIWLRTGRWPERVVHIRFSRLRSGGGRKP